MIIFPLSALGNPQTTPNVIELRDLIFTFKDKTSFLECSNRVTALISIITDDALHIFLNSVYRNFKVADIGILRSFLPQNDMLTYHSECSEAE